MTIKEAPPWTDREEDAPQGEVLVQQPDPDFALATSRPPSIADSASTLGAKRANTTSILSNKTLVAQSKVAIPRQRAGITQRYNRRVPRACESCRARKTKCSGDAPVCRQCRELRATCNYPQGWREKTKK